MVGSVKLFFCQSDASAVQGHLKSLILVPIESAKCDFLLVRNSNLDPVLHRFGDTVLQVFCAPDLTPPLFHHNFGGVPVAPGRPRWRQCEQVHALSYSAMKLSKCICDHGSPT